MGEDLFPENHLKVEAPTILKKRVAAAGIDYGLLLIVFVTFPSIIGQKTENGYVVTGFLALIPVYLWVLNFIIIERVFSASVGKLFLGIKVQSMDGYNLMIFQLVVRRLADFIEIVWCFGLIAYLFAKNRKDHRRIGDMWAKTEVVSRN